MSPASLHAKHSSRGHTAVINIELKHRLVISPTLTTQRSSVRVRALGELAATRVGFCCTRCGLRFRSILRRPHLPREDTGALADGLLHERDVGGHALEVKVALAESVPEIYIQNELSWGLLPGIVFN